MVLCFIIDRLTFKCCFVVYEILLLISSVCNIQFRLLLIQLSNGDSGEYQT